MILVISDTHDYTVYIDKLVKIYKNEDIDAIIHCGDVVEIVGPVIEKLEKLEKHGGWNVHTLTPSTVWENRYGLFNGAVCKRPRVFMACFS